MRSLGKAFLDLLTGSAASGDAADDGNGDRKGDKGRAQILDTSMLPADPDDMTDTPAAARAYSKAGRVVEKHGKPYLTPPSAGDRGPAMAGIPEPVMHDPDAIGAPSLGRSDSTQGKEPSRSQAPGSTPSGRPPGANPSGPKPLTAERDALIKRAVAIHRAKRGILDNLSAEQREQLAKMALAAFQVKR